MILSKSIKTRKSSKTMNLFIYIALFNVITLFYTQTAFAQFYEGHADGWHWYNNEEVEEVEEKKDEQSSKDKDPVKQMNALRATIKRTLDKAILYPTDRNVKNYISLQNRLSNQATLFANVWQRVLLKNPSLNYALVHPTNSLARQVDLDIQHKKEDAAIAKLAKESGLFFFYRSSCLYCRKFAPILKNFTLRHNITVVPITLDGISLPEFPESKPDKGQASKFNVTVEPSLFAVNPYGKKAYPVSYGLISEEALRKRILDIAQNFIGDI